MATLDVDALLPRMTIDEKLAQLGCVWCTALVADDAFSTDAAARWLEHGIGEITRIPAIRVGAGWRRRTASRRTSRAGSASRTCAACKAISRTAWPRPASTSSATRSPTAG